MTPNQVWLAVRDGDDSMMVRADRITGLQMSGSDNAEFPWELEVFIPGLPSQRGWLTVARGASDQWSKRAPLELPALLRGKELDRLEGGSTVAYAVVADEFDSAENGLLDIVWSYK
ncbi:hypothetical protein [Kitasatospora cathayae]|uniref:Uncharacterized protein n=1 Tax=Kitasatospora cathayae TaxID=3004092 RepID=A0ABY7QH75_9ACTN|nr:hypothetical protein [Kitasatospora sp. HUAS 3-15]WBP92178.1 hypothetical protein O1G21_41265 [Kitasatospora sp. HUAS 3-15]